MLHIIWLILKIIGLILLAVLAFALLALASVLFVPIRYKAEGGYQKEPRGYVRLTWLLHILSVKAVYDGELDIIIRLFGFRIFKPGKEAEMGDELILQSQDLAHDLEQELLEEAAEEPAPEPLEEKKVQTEKRVQTEKKKKAAKEKKEPAPDRGKAGSEKSRWEHLKESAAEKYLRMKQAVLDLEINLEKGKAFLEDEENKRTFKLLVKSAKALLKHIRPRRLKGEVRFGFDDPYTTGQVLTAASMLYPLYGQQIRLYPEFEQSVFEAEGELKGRIRLGTVLYWIARVYLNKNFRTLLKKRKLRNGG